MYVSLAARALVSDCELAETTVGEFAAAAGLELQKLHELAEGIRSGLEAIAHKLAPMLSAAAEFVEQLDRTPEVPGYARLLREEFGYHPLLARLCSYWLLHLGRELKRENLVGRRAGALVRQIASRSQNSDLAISRRAAELNAFYGYARPALDEAIVASRSESDVHSFANLVARAAARNRDACLELQRLCTVIARHVPDPRGRDLSRSRATHTMLKMYLANGGKTAGHTFDPYQDDYVDKVTAATRTAFAEPRFCPRRSKLDRRD